MLLVVLIVPTLGCARENDDRDSPAAVAPRASASATETPAKHRAQCIVADPEGQVILHPGSLTPDGELVLDDVALQQAVNLEVIERDVVRFAGRSTVQGIIQDYPPLKNAGLADSLADWDARRPLAGLALTPDDGQQAVLVAVQLSDPTTPGHLDGVTLTSDAGETAYAQPLLVVPHGALCTVDAYDSTLAWVP